MHFSACELLLEIKTLASDFTIVLTSAKVSFLDYSMCSDRSEAFTTQAPYNILWSVFLLSFSIFQLTSAVTSLGGSCFTSLYGEHFLCSLSTFCFLSYCLLLKSQFT